MHEVEIRNEPARRLAAMMHKGSFMGVGEVFQRLGAWAAANDMFRPGAEMLFVQFDHPRKTPVDRLRSAACVTAPAGFEGDPDAGVTIVELTPGPFAVALVKGAYDGLPGAWGWLYDTWLPASGRTPAYDRPSFELYLNNPTQVAPDECLTTIHAPIV